MSEYPKNSGELPVLKLCNRYKPNCPKMNVTSLGPLGGKHNKDAKLIKHLQLMLRTLGYDLGTTGENKDGVDGNFRKLTRDTVIDFQRNNKDWDGKQLKDDGLVGPKTADALNRTLVGVWYDKYQTPEILTKDKLYVTLTNVAFEKGIFFNPKKIKKTRMVLVDLDKHIITLFDSSGIRFSFDGEGEFRVLDTEEQILTEGKMTSKDDICFTSEKVPFMVELNVDDNIFTFFLEKE